MHIIKKLSIIILITQQTFVLAMFYNPCPNGVHESIRYVEVIPVYGNTAMNRCTSCCDQAEQRVIEQCLLCHKWSASNSPHIKPIEFFSKQTEQEYALSHACVHGHFTIAKELLNNGVNPDTRLIFANGTTPLMGTKNVDIVTALLHADASPNLLSLDGKTALIYNVSQLFTETPQESLDTHKAIIQKLLAAKANPDLHANDLATPLIIALRSKYGRENIVEMLLKAGANPNHEPIRGDSPLGEAGDDQNMIKLLKQYGAVEKRAAL